MDVCMHKQLNGGTEDLMSQLLMIVNMLPLWRAHMHTHVHTLLVATPHVTHSLSLLLQLHPPYRAYSVSQASLPLQNNPQVEVIQI